jgi:hypothetical protein
MKKRGKGIERGREGECVCVKISRAEKTEKGKVLVVPR